MNRDKFAAAHGSIGRADLLRALAVAHRDKLAVDHTADGWFGYVEVVTQPGPIVAAVPKLRPPDIVDTLLASDEGARVPLRMRFAHSVVMRRPRAIPDAVTRSTVDLAEVAAIDEASARAPSQVCLIDYEDLVPQARLLPVLRGFLGAKQAGVVDVERLIKSVATREPQRRLPRKHRLRWHPDLVVVLDFCARLWPYREDMHRLAERLLRYCGRSGVSLRIVNHGPLGPFSDWQAVQNRYATDIPPQRPWLMPRAGTPVLIVSDLGRLLSAQSTVRSDWREFIARLKRAQLRPVALAPLGAEQLDAEIAQALPVLRWSPDAPTRPARASGIAHPVPNGLGDLLAMVAATRRVDPPLLRAMRRLNPSMPLNAGLEGALWCHTDIEPGRSVSIKPEARVRYLQQFTRQLGQLHQQIDQLRTQHHAHLRAVLNHEETLLWAAHADPSAVLRSEARVEEARQFMRGLTATLQDASATSPDNRWRTVARGIIDRADAMMGAREGEVLHPMLAALWRGGDQSAQSPGWADPAEIERLLQGEPAQCWLVRDAARNAIVLQAAPPGLGQSALDKPLFVDVGGVRLSRGTVSGSRLYSSKALPFEVIQLDDLSDVVLDTSRESIAIAAVQRPSGALGWSVGPSGFSVQSPPFVGRTASWSADVMLQVPTLTEPRAFQAPWHLEAIMEDNFGSHARLGLDSYGVFAEFGIESSGGEVVQRLRWIEPGVFWMGSPESEAERSDDEGPRHQVTLTRGFWLADTACTQALWQAVMGDNPSHFEGDARCPVEQVSWDDVERFMRKLESLLPGSEAGLPTEAEWEYACRAGTQSAFSFGEQITPEQVNYDGNHPYAGGKKGQYRERTVAVKSLPPNAWGLYEMQGNVGEWCADGLRGYNALPQRDPVGLVETGGGARRALRGGSWLVFAWWARSAFRGAGTPGDAYLGLGFRLCLRSIEPGQVRNLGGVWVTAWLSVKRQRPHKATLMIPANHGTTFTASMMITYERFGQESVVEEQLAATWRDNILSLVGVSVAYQQRGASIAYSLDAFELRVTSDGSALVGKGIFKNGTREVTFTRDFSDSTSTDTSVTS